MLPSPLPDDPRKWDGWNRYSSPDLYERLGLSYKNTRELNAIVDALPAARPKFVPEELLVGGTVFL